MSDFNRVILGNTPYDQKAVISGLKKFFESKEQVLSNNEVKNYLPPELDNSQTKTITISGEINSTESD